MYRPTSPGYEDNLDQDPVPNIATGHDVGEAVGGGPVSSRGNRGNRGRGGRWQNRGQSQLRNAPRYRSTENLHSINHTDVYKIILQQYGGGARTTQIRKLFPKEMSLPDISNYFRGKTRDYQFYPATDTQGDLVKIFCPKLRLCFNTSQGCSVTCPYLHLCQKFLISDCRVKDQCKFDHILKDGPNGRILKKHIGLLYSLSDNDILSIIRNSFPRLCRYYNEHGCRNPDSCFNFHLCKNYIMNKPCLGDCGKAHDFSGEHTGQLLKHFNLKQDLNENFLRRTFLLYKPSRHRNPKKHKIPGSGEADSGSDAESIASQDDQTRRNQGQDQRGRGRRGRNRGGRGRPPRPDHGADQRTHSPCSELGAVGGYVGTGAVGHLPSELVMPRQISGTSSTDLNTQNTDDGDFNASDDEDLLDYDRYRGYDGQTAAPRRPASPQRRRQSSSSPPGPQPYRYVSPSTFPSPPRIRTPSPGPVPRRALPTPFPRRASPVPLPRSASPAPLPRRASPPTPAFSSRHTGVSRNFEWQMELFGTWCSLGPNDNDNVEQYFCQPIKDVSIKISDGTGVITNVVGQTFKFSFDEKLEAIDEHGISCVPVKRKEKNSAATKWKWYIRLADGKWIEFLKANGCPSSDEIEAAYKMGTDLPFSSSGFRYKLSFTDMRQENLMTKTTRRLRRRPVQDWQ